MLQKDALSYFAALREGKLRATGERSKVTNRHVDGKVYRTGGQTESSDTPGQFAAFTL